MEPPAPKYQITKITIKRGIAVPMAKTPGKITPYVVEKVTGMSNIKNKMNIVGQNPREKLKPSIKAPQFPFLCLLFSQP